MDESQREFYINNLLMFMYKIVKCSGGISHKDKNEFLRAANMLKEFAGMQTEKPLTRLDVNMKTADDFSRDVRRILEKHKEQTNE